MIGASWGWPTGTPAQRAQLYQAHFDYTAGFFWTLANDPAMPAAIRTQMSSWGLAKDEFTDNGNWPPQLYVREGRRMVGEYVLTQWDRQVNRNGKPDSIGLFSYNIDTHNAQREWRGAAETRRRRRARVSATRVRARGVWYVCPCAHPLTGFPQGTYVRNEGDVEQFGSLGPGQLPYRIVTPNRAEATNLLVPVAASASHLGFGTVRLEPQWMILGHSCGVAAAMAVKAGVAVQDVPIAALQATLQAQGQILYE